MKGRWAMRAFRWMNRLRWLRGSPLDPFRNSAEARLARALLAEYEADLDLVLARMAERAGPVPDGATLLALLDLPDRIRGYGHVRARHAEETRAKRAALRAQLGSPVAEAA